MRKKRKFDALPYLLIIPTFAGAILFHFYPFFKTIISSFSFTDPITGNWLKWAGLYSWKRMVEDTRFWSALINTLKYAVLIFAGTFTIAMLMALMAAKQSRLGKAAQMLYALPIAVSHSTSSIIFLMAFKSGSGGLLNSYLGTDIGWVTRTETGFWVIVVVTVWTHISGAFLYLLAGFRSVSEDIQEAAIVDGANAFTRAIKIMIPIASPQIFYVVFLNIISSLGIFTQVKLLTESNPTDGMTSLMYEIYRHGNNSGRYELACCISIVAFVLIFAVTRIQFAFEKKMVYYQ